MDNLRGAGGKSAAYSEGSEFVFRIERLLFSLIRSTFRISPNHHYLKIC
jgi:hypothetical protein